MTKTGSDCSHVPLKTTEEDKKKHREGAAAKLIWLHHAVLSDLDGIFILKEEKRTPLRAFEKGVTPD